VGDDEGGSGGLVKRDGAIGDLAQIHIFAKLHPVAHGHKTRRFSYPAAVTVEVENVSFGGFEVFFGAGTDGCHIPATGRAGKQKEMCVGFFSHKARLYPLRGVKWRQHITSGKEYALSLLQGHGRQGHGCEPQVVTTSLFCWSNTIYSPGECRASSSMRTAAFGRFSTASIQMGFPKRSFFKIS